MGMSLSNSTVTPAIPEVQEIHIQRSPLNKESKRLPGYELITRNKFNKAPFSIDQQVLLPIYNRQNLLTEEQVQTLINRVKSRKPHIPVEIQTEPITIYNGSAAENVDAEV